MSTEVLEPPPISPSDSDQLKANFNAQLQAEVEKEAPQEEVQKTKAVPVKEEKTESLVPAEFLTEKKEEKLAEEPLVSDEIRNSIKGNSRASFEKLENAAKARIEALQKQLAEAKAKPAPSTDTEALTKQAKEASERAAQLEKEFERVAYTESPKYRRFGNEEGAELKLAKSYLEGGEVNPAIIDAAAQTQGAARMKIMRDAGLDAETIAILSPHMARVDSIRRERDQSLESWKSNLEQDQQQAKAYQEQQVQQRVQQEKAIFSEVMDSMKNDPAFTRVEGRDQWNAIVEQNFKEAEEFALGRKPLNELFKLGIDGVSARTTRLMNVELTKRCNEQAEQLARLKAAQPGIGKHTETETKKVSGDTSKDQTEHLKNAFNVALEEVKTKGFTLQ